MRGYKYDDKFGKNLGEEGREEGRRAVGLNMSGTCSHSPHTVLLCIFIFCSAV